MQAFLFLALASGLILTTSNSAAHQAPTVKSVTTTNQQARAPSGITRSPCGRNGCLSPVEVVTFADAVAPKAGVTGVLEMTVRNVGLNKGMVYLGSEADYRGRNNVTVALPANLAGHWLKGQPVTEQNLKRIFMSKRIFARGTAWRVRINFLDDLGAPTDKYYYQIQMRLRAQEQLLLDAK